MECVVELFKFYGIDCHWTGHDIIVITEDESPDIWINETTTMAELNEILDLMKVE